MLRAAARPSSGAKLDIRTILNNFHYKCHRCGKRKGNEGFRGDIGSVALQISSSITVGMTQPGVRGDLRSLLIAAIQGFSTTPHGMRVNSNHAQ